MAQETKNARVMEQREGEGADMPSTLSGLVTGRGSVFLATGPFSRDFFHCCDQA